MAHLAAFLGLAPVEKRSGTSVRGRTQMSKIGPPEMRAKLYVAALCGLRFNIAMKSMYERLCLNGKAKMVAIGALMRKLIHWCFGVLVRSNGLTVDCTSLRGKVAPLVHKRPLRAKSGSCYSSLSWSFGAVQGFTIPSRCLTWTPADML